VRRVSPLLFRQHLSSRLSNQGLHPRGWSFHPLPHDLILTESSLQYGTVSFLYQSQDSRLMPSRHSCFHGGGTFLSKFYNRIAGSCPSSLPHNIDFSITIYIFSVMGCYRRIIGMILPIPLLPTPSSFVSILSSLPSYIPPNIHFGSTPVIIAVTLAIPL